MTPDSSIIQHCIAEHIQTMELVRNTLGESIERIAGLLVRSLADGGTVFWCGNGGSAADSQHLAAELVGRFRKERRALRSIALSTDTSILTCVANDYGYADVFSRQVEALGRPADVLIGISTSGNSASILRAFETAKARGLSTVALLGKGGGAAGAAADHALVIPSGTTARIQEAHILIGHILCELIERGLEID